MGNGRSLPSVGPLGMVENSGGVGPIKQIIVQYLYENIIIKSITLVISKTKQFASNIVLPMEWSSLQISLLLMVFKTEEYILSNTLEFPRLL